MAPPQRSTSRGLATSGASSASSSSSKTRSAEATADCITLAMLASCVIGYVNWREYWMNACTSPSESLPVATCTPPITAIAT